MVSKLHAILKPFMLRRLKSDVAIGLPRKAEILLYSQVGRKGAAWKGGGGGRRGREGRDGQEGSSKMPGPHQSRRPSPPVKASPCLPRKTPHFSTQYAHLSFQMTEVQKGLNKQLLDGTLKVCCSSLSHLPTCIPCSRVT